MPIDKEEKERASNISEAAMVSALFLVEVVLSRLCLMAQAPHPEW
jgi:hypothetical protein